MDLALTFDDVALVPQYNNVESRTEPKLNTWLTKSLKTGLPLIPSNMDTVISPELSEVLLRFNGNVIDHRFHGEGLKDRIVEFARPICISWGLKRPADLLRLLAWGKDAGHIWGVCFDVAHGHSKGMFKAIHIVKEVFSDSIDVIAGNVCTADGYRDLVNAGADAVKVGVGCGAACTTRLVTGFGTPQFTAIQNCAKVARKLRVPIIADGGIRNSRDIVLALAAGASTVMMGKMFAACDESAAEKRCSDMYDYEAVARGIVPPGTQSAKPIKIDEAKYRGQASFDFQQEFYGEVRNAPEGEAMWIPVSGTTEDMVTELTKQIKAGLTYCGARDIKELQRKAEFVRVTNTYQAESGIRP